MNTYIKMTILTKGIFSRNANILLQFFKTNFYRINLDQERNIFGSIPMNLSGPEIYLSGDF